MWKLKTPIKGFLYLASKLISAESYKYKRTQSQMNVLLRNSEDKKPTFYGNCWFICAGI